ncbi:NADH-dependent alcohol dehydrogenase, partial [Lysinibacillus agricola]
LGTVLTFVVIGFEMNFGFVIINVAIEEKLSWGSFVVFLKFLILNLVYIVTVLKDYIVYGIVDMMLYVFE